MPETAQPQPVPPPQLRPFFERMKWFTEKLIIPLMLLILGAGIGYWMQSKKPHLLYSFGEVIQFTGEKDEFGLILVTVTNDGAKEAEDVQCVVELNDCIIQDVKASPRNLNPKTVIQRAGNEAHITIDSLNQSEQLSLMIKATKPNQLEKSLNVTVRGKGINGEFGKIERGQPLTVTGIVTTLVFCFFALSGSLGLFAVSVETIRQKIKSHREKKNPKKLFRFETGEKGGQVISGVAAIDAYNKLPKPMDKINYDNVPYFLAKTTLLPDGTLEFLFLDDVATRYFNQKKTS